MPKKPPRKPPSQRRQPEPPEDNYPPGPLRARLADPEFRQGLQDAGIIFGVDSLTGNSSLFFGKVTLERIVATGNAKEMAVVNVPVDFQTDDVECLCATLLVLKGSHCYQTGDGEADPIRVGLN